MTTEIMAYATTGREFEVMADLAALGVTHWPGRRIEFERRGKSRVAEPFEYPALPMGVVIRSTATISGKGWAA